MKKKGVKKFFEATLFIVFSNLPFALLPNEPETFAKFSKYGILEPCPLNRYLIGLNRWGSVPDQFLRLVSFAKVSGRNHLKNINTLIFNIISTLY